MTRQRPSSFINNNITNIGKEYGLYLDSEIKEISKKKRERLVVE